MGANVKERQVGLVNANCYYHKAQLAGGREGYDLLDVVLG